MPAPTPRRALTAALALAGLLCGAAPAAADAPDFAPGEVVVRYAADADRPARAAAQAGTGTDAADTVAPRTRVLRIEDGESVAETIAELRRRPGVLSATPNWIARISQAWIPNDTGASDVPGGWRELQWNFSAEVGVNAPGAWANLQRAGRPGGRGATVAVLDTGVAYSNREPFVRSPDLSPRRFLRGYDFVAEDRYPHDHNGHGTHVASTIAESTGNGLGLTGLAYGSRILPVRVLNANGEGRSSDIAAGIRYAARRDVDVINLSFEFGIGITASQIPEILDAVRYARRAGVLVVGASGNESGRAIAYPAKSSQVLAVGATTEHLCQAEYSNQGHGLDVVAPGGGADAPVPGDANCRPLDAPGRPIYQLTFARERDPRSFGFPADYAGTSMAAPHVSGIAALVIASRVLGRAPTPAAVEARLKATARDLGEPGADRRYGAGLVDAAAATDPAR